MTNNDVPNWGFPEEDENQEKTYTVPNTNNSDILNNIATGSVSRERSRKFKGYYLEHEVADAIDREISRKFPKRVPRGAKSDYVNELLRRALVREGVLADKNEEGF